MPVLPPAEEVGRAVRDAVSKGLKPKTLILGFDRFNDSSESIAVTQIRLNELTPEEGYKVTDLTITKAHPSLYLPRGFALGCD